MKDPRIAASAALAALLAVTPGQGPAGAQELFGLDLRGSLGQEGFTRYVPPVTMFVLNETPYITTEVKPIFIYHSIPDGFVTDGGRVIGGAVQGRLALGDRFGIIATTDGYADIDFEEVLPDTDGFLDIAAGAKYAIISDPEKQQIVTVGARYTAPVGNIDTAGIDLTGSHDGFLNAFVTGAKEFTHGGVQGTAGYQHGISDESWSYIHLHGHAHYAVTERFFPLFEVNAIIPTDGGDRIPGASLTGADVFDIGASDPSAILTLAGGLRYRPLDNLILGAAIEGNVLDAGSSSADSVYGWRITTDVTLHF